MSRIALSSAELREFSVPDVFCLLGERQYLLGLGGVMVATSMRVTTRVEETPDEFRLRFSPTDPHSPEITDILGRWREALKETARDEDQLYGLDIICELPSPDLPCPTTSRMMSPAIAVSLATVLCAHRRQDEMVNGEQLGAMAGKILERVVAPDGTYPSRFDSLCRTCVEGGVRYVKSSGEALNAQLLVPPESLLLVVDPETANGGQETKWGENLLSALQKLGGTEALLERTEEEGITGLFDLAGDELSDQEMAVLYALVRVRGMLQEMLETLDRDVRDNDRMAEICDEESIMMRDYFGFPGENLQEIRHKAVEAGALGAKFTYAFGESPALLALAPGRRDEVRSALVEEYGEQSIVQLDVNHSGIRSERL